MLLVRLARLKNQKWMLTCAVDFVFFSSHSLQASAYYVKGLQSFFQARYQEAK